MELLPEIAGALSANPAAKAAYEKLPPSHKAEYVKWVAEAKQEATRKRRAKKMAEMLVKN